MKYRDKKNKIKKIYDKSKQQLEEIEKKKNTVESLLLNIATWKHIVKLYESDWEEMSPTFPTVSGFEETWDSIEETSIDSVDGSVIAADYPGQRSAEESDELDISQIGDNSWAYYYYPPKIFSIAKIEVMGHDPRDFDSGDTSHFANYETKKEIEGNDNKIYRIYSKNQVNFDRPYMPDIGASTYCNSWSASRTTDNFGSQLYTNSLTTSSSLSIPVTQEVAIMTSGSQTLSVLHTSDSIGGAPYIDPNDQHAKCDTLLQIIVTKQGGGHRYVNYYYKATNADDDYKPSWGGTFEVDWTNMNRNFYDDLKTVLADEYGENIEDTDYNISYIYMAFRVDMYLEGEPDHAYWTLNEGEMDVRLDSLKITTAQEGYTIFEYDVLSDEITITDTLLPFVDYTILTKYENNGYLISIPEEEGKREWLFIRTGENKYKLRAKGVLYIRKSKSEMESEEIAYPRTKMITTFISPLEYRQLTKIL